MSYKISAYLNLLQEKVTPPRFQETEISSFENHYVDTTLYLNMQMWHFNSILFFVAKYS